MLYHHLLRPMGFIRLKLYDVHTRIKILRRNFYRGCPYAFVGRYHLTYDFEQFNLPLKGHMGSVCN
jgi:hypothetical protein